MVEVCVTVGSFDGKDVAVLVGGTVETERGGGGLLIFPLQPLRSTRMRNNVA